MSAQQDSVVTTQRVETHLRSRFNPIRSLTPDTLSRALDAFAGGYLREAAILFEAIEQRDDQVKAVAPKRKKAVARNGYEVVTVDDSPAAQQHKEALEFFYGNLSATNALNRNERGGVRLLIRQMMDAHAKGFAAHEIIWQPAPGGELTAQFNFVPLWFFENTTGKLRFLQQDFALAGTDLNDGEWLVTCGDALMIACSVAYIYKQLSLRDWVIFNERHGMPGFLGKTSATKGSEQWDAMVEAVQTISAEWSGVVTTGDAIDVLDLKGSAGQNPYQPLIERMDRSIACLWRGADLSTLSAGSAIGASVQGGETDILEADDVEMISETLNEQVDRFVIAHLFGEGVEPLAWFALQTAAKENTERDIKIDEFLGKAGIRQTKQSVAERYGRALPPPEAPEEDLVDAVASTAGGDGLTPARREVTPSPELANERRGVTPSPDAAGAGEFLAKARLAIAGAVQADLQPLAAGIAKILPLLEGDGAVTPETVAALTKFRDETLPALLSEGGADRATVEAFAGVFSASFLNGLTEAAP